MTETCQRLLLRIMSTLDDTCIIKRVGEERAQQVKREAEALLLKIPDQVRNDDLKALCDRYAAENISPGGAADMLSLTIFIDSIFRVEEDRGFRDMCLLERQYI